MALVLSDLKMIVERVSNAAPLQDVGALKTAVASVWIASGLAKISAAYGAALIEQCAGQPSQVTTPLDYCQKPFLLSLPLLVSLKGVHEDAVSVAKSITRRPVDQAFLITGEPDGPAALALKASRSKLIIVTANFPERDRRFVNCRSIFMLSALSYQIVKQAFGSEHVRKIDEQMLTHFFNKAVQEGDTIAQGIAMGEDWQNRQIIILGQGLRSELTLPWQSVFSEAGIATPICLDIKDYTHGDHLAAVRANNAIFLVIQHPGIEEICHVFVSRFSTRFPVVVVSLESQGPIQFWENLFYCCNTADALTSMLNYSEQRPPKDPVVNSWRGWGNLI